jgi:3-oxoacyl-[acyl-carrier-protein] synthase III
MDGKAVRNFITEIFPRMVTEATDIKPADLALVIPHQPNPRLLASLATKAGLEPQQLVIVGENVGNIGAASLPTPWTTSSAHAESSPASRPGPTGSPAPTGRPGAPMLGSHP